MYRKTILYMLFVVFGLNVFAQRIYKSNSVLASGNWFKISVKQNGVYKIDIPFLNSLGLSTQNLSSSAIRIFGNGGSMLSETNADLPKDDLEENALMIVDGGDGIFSGSDYLLFYAAGPHQWNKDSVNKRFSHKRNIYSDKAFYFLTVGGLGKRIQAITNNLSSNITITNFNERYFHELDTVNFLASGKEWYGEELSSLPGRSLSRSFDFTIPNISSNVDATLITNCIARSVGASSRFDVKINSQPLQQINILPTGNGQYDLFAQQTTSVASTNISQNNISVNYSFVPASFNAQGWMNWFEFFTRRNLSMSGINQLSFRDWLSVADNNTGEFIISNT